MKTKTLNLPLDLIVLLKLVADGEHIGAMWTRRDHGISCNQHKIADDLGISQSSLNASLHRLVRSRLVNPHYRKHRIIAWGVIIAACAEFFSVIQYCFWFADGFLSLTQRDLKWYEECERNENFKYLCIVLTRLIIGTRPDNCETRTDVEELLKIELEAIYSR